MTNNEQIITTVSKAGKNLFAKIPERDKERISRGDKVKIVILEKVVIKDKKQVLKGVNFIVNNPNGERLKGNILGYEVTIPLNQILKNMKKEDAIKLLYAAIMGEEQ